MKMAAARTMLLVVVLGALFGVLGGGAADAVQGCPLNGPQNYLCYTTAGGGLNVLVFSDRSDLGVALGALCCNNKATGAAVSNGKTYKTTQVVLFCNPDTHRWTLGYGVNKPSHKLFSTGISC